MGRTCEEGQIIRSDTDREEAPDSGHIIPAWKLLAWNLGVQLLLQTTELTITATFEVCLDFSLPSQGLKSSVTPHPLSPWEFSSGSGMVISIKYVKNGNTYHQWGRKERIGQHWPLDQRFFSFNEHESPQEILLNCRFWCVSLGLLWDFIFLIKSSKLEVRVRRWGCTGLCRMVLNVSPCTWTLWVSTW
jgi:hypothetical protein